MNAVFSAILVALTLLLVGVGSYKVLMIPLPGKSHIFAFAAMADGLADRGHSVSFFVGENYPLKEAALRRRDEISVVTYKDSADGSPLDYDAVFENMTRMVMDKQADIFVVAPMVKQRSLPFQFYVRL